MATSTRWNNSDQFGSSWLLSNEQLMSKNGVGWSRRLRMAGVVPKVVTRKQVGGQLERRGIPRSVPSNPVETRDRSQDS